MTDRQIDAAIVSSVVGLTRHVMSNGKGLAIDEAYRKVYGSELYKLLANPRTRLFLCPNVELCALYDIESKSGVEELHRAIMP